jgi:hypothetical protein
MCDDGDRAGAPRTPAVKLAPSAALVIGRA